MGHRGDLCPDVANGTPWKPFPPRAHRWDTVETVYRGNLYAPHLWETVETSSYNSQTGYRGNLYATTGYRGNLCSIILAYFYPMGYRGNLSRTCFHGIPSVAVVSTVSYRSHWGATCPTRFPRSPIGRTGFHVTPSVAVVSTVSHRSRRYPVGAG